MASRTKGGGGEVGKRGGEVGKNQRFRGHLCISGHQFCKISKNLDNFHNFVIFIGFVDLHCPLVCVLCECVSEVTCQFIPFAKRWPNVCKQNRQYDNFM